MKANELKVGSVIETYDGFNWNWIERTITKVSDSYVWFKGSGVQRLHKNTFENWPTLYRIKSI